MILEKMETIVIGAGKGSDTVDNPQQQAFVTKGMLKSEATLIHNFLLEYRQKSKVNCEKNVSWYNKGWTACMVNTMGSDHDKILEGDSGWNSRAFYVFGFKLNM